MEKFQAAIQMDRGFFRKHLSCLLGPNDSVFTDGQTGFNSAFSFAQAGNNVLQFASPAVVLASVQMYAALP